MDFDKIKETIEKPAKDDSVQAEFKKNPIGAIEKELGVNLPDEQVKEVVSHLKDKFDDDFFDGLKDKAEDILEKVESSGIIDKAGDVLEKVEHSGIADKVKDIFKKD